MNKPPALFVSGCSSNGPSGDRNGQSGDGPAGVADSIENLANWELTDSPTIEGAYATPLELVMYPDEQRTRAVLDATTESIRECMTERGFPDFDYAARTSTMSERAYGVVDVETARVWGFGPVGGYGPQDDQDAPPPDPSIGPTDLEAAFSGREENRTLEVKDSDGRVLARVDPNSCRWIAEAEHQPHAIQISNLMNQLFQVGNQASDIVEMAPEFQESFAEWNECMVAKGGVPTTSPWHSDYNSTDPATEDEIHAAVISAECKHESGFLREWTRLLALEQARLVDESPGTYIRLQELMQETFGDS